MDTEYILDCSLELAETTALEYAVLSDPQGAYSVVRRIVDEDLELPRDFLANTARHALESAAEPQRHRFAMAAVGVLETSVQRWKERMAFVVQKQLQEDLGVRQVLALDLGRGGCSPGQPAARFVAHETEVSEGVVRQVLEHHFAGAVARWHEDCRHIERSLRWVAQVGPDAWRQMGLLPEGVRAPALPGGLQGGHDASEVLAWLRQQRLQMERKKTARERSLVQRAKSAIKKATKLFEQLGLDRELSLFVSGQEVVLSKPGAALKVVVKPLSVQGWLLDRTQVGRSHTPYELHVLTASDVHVAKLCVFFRDTPVLDQLMALSLFMQSGQELELLEKANWFACESTPESVRKEVALAYPSLASKFPSCRTDAGQPHRKLVRLPAYMEREEHHWEPFKGRVEQWVATWLEPVTQRALDFRAASELVQAIRQPHALQGCATQLPMLLAA